MSKELKWCENFRKAMHLRTNHKRKKIRIKNHHRLMQMKKRAFQKWGCFPYPPEWK